MEIKGLQRELMKQMKEGLGTGGANNDVKLSTLLITYHTESKESLLDQEVTELAVQLNESGFKKRIKNENGLESYLQSKFHDFKEAKPEDKDEAVTYIDEEHSLDQKLLVVLPSLKVVVITISCSERMSHDDRYQQLVKQLNAQLDLIAKSKEAKRYFVCINAFTNGQRVSQSRFEKVKTDVWRDLITISKKRGSISNDLFFKSTQNGSFISELDSQQSSMRMSKRTRKIDKFVRIAMRGIGTALGILLLVQHSQIEEQCYAGNVVFLPIVASNPFQVDENGKEYFKWEIDGQVVMDTSGENDTIQEFFKNEFTLVNDRFEGSIYTYTILSVISGLLIFMDMLHEAKKGWYKRLMWMSTLFPVMLTVNIIWIIYQRNRFKTRVCFGDFKDELFKTAYNV